MSCCGKCGHDRDAHLRGGECGWIIPAGGLKTVCACRRFRSLESLLVQRVAVIFAAVFVLGTAEGLIGMVPR